MKKSWAPPVRSTTLDEVLDILDRHAWAVRACIPRLRKGSHAHSFMEGRLAQILGVLRECGALPAVLRSSADVPERVLISARAQLPRGFKHLPIAKAREWLWVHGIKAALYEVPHLQRHLAAGLREQEHVAVAVSPVAKPD